MNDTKDSPVQLPPFNVNEPPFRTVLQPFKVSGKETKAPPLQGFSLSNFYQVARQEGFARSFLFRVKSISNVDLGHTLLYAISAKIPDRKINTTTINYQSYSFRVPMAADYPDKENWSLKFYCDANYYLRSTLEDWSKSLYNPNTFKSTATLNEFNIELVLLQPTSNQLVERQIYKLIGCIPVLINTPDYNTTRSGDIVTVNTTIAFQYVESNVIPMTKQPESLIDKINKFTKGVKNVTSGVKQITSAVNNVAGVSRTLRTTARELRNIRR